MGDVPKLVRPLPRGEYRLLDNITFNIGRLASSYNRSAVRYYLRHFDLSVAEVHVLNVIGHYEPVLAVDVAGTALMDKGLVSRAVAKLTEVGLVARSADAADGRRQILTLTRSGRVTWSGVWGAKQRRHHRFLETLTEAETEQLFGILARLQDNADRVEREEAAEGGEARVAVRGRAPGAPVDLAPFVPDGERRQRGRS
ncbi:winged helix-turn-helix transcriptional regulator [Methylobacterium mesophilicum SR1.6/6]|uniref:Winged helix-turn-helix transcriptional regulator n=1 Tax=Methylobacterium mesophilicum SR1.6/6 TaxID=908290 RepID=A0A6B9G1R6_9HYPH|nr:MarR family winged helix-turn-helix transcriptional regulator [Methylobacterium mesophilicum]QGY05875.1 winged helix-turn-helix transcriptional regulator [Methylobacterium mesophilicum SR1.6/6]